MMTLFLCASADDGTVSKSQRLNPGPGAYAAKGDRYRSNPSWRVGTAKRAGMDNKNTKFVPGPSQYNLKSKVGEAPAFFMGEKCGDGSLSTAGKFVPGPGAYSP